MEAPPGEGTPSDQEVPSTVDVPFQNEALSAEGARKSLPDRALVLHLSGWWPAFSVAFVLCAALLLQEGARTVLTIGLSAASLCAGLFTLIVGPFLGRWRASIKGARGHLPISALLCAGLLVWTIVSLAGLLILSAIIVSWNGHPPNPAEELLPELDRIIDGVSSSTFVLAWLAGLAACLVGREMVRDEAVAYSGGSTWRKTASVLLLLPYLWAAQLLLGAVWQGAGLDADLRRAYQADIEAALSHSGDSQETALLDFLPNDFREAPVVSAWLAQKSSSPSKWNKMLKLWCEQAARFWSGDEFWNRPPLVALAQLARGRSIVERSDLRPSLQAEVAVRSEVILVEHGGVGVTHSQRLYEMELPSETWGRLVDLGLSRSDLLRSATLDDRDVRERFVQDSVRLLNQGDYDLDGNPQRHFFERCDERRRLNDLWQSYQASKPYPEPGPPLDRKTFAARYASSLNFDLRGVDHDITQVTFGEEVARQTLAYDIVMMELKRLEAAAAPLPGSWENFRPEIGALGLAYQDWILLAVNDGGVSLRRADPRHGSRLTHSFKSAPRGASGTRRTSLQKTGAP